MVEFTGERLVPGQVDQDLLNEHMSRYAFAARLARNKRVLDIACGMGYGSFELSKHAARVVGLDVSEEAVNSARERYQSANLQFLTAPAQQIPLDDHSFDLIVAFEVIEHLSDWEELLGQAKRLLAPGGQFIVSTPNKAYYAETRRLAGPNPFHVHEFEFSEFQSELGRFFPSVTMFLQNHVQAISFHPTPGGSGLVAELEAGSAPAQPETSHFFLAVCALAPQTGSPVYLYLPTSSNVLREREQHIALLESELAKKDSWLEDLKQDHARLNTLHEELRAETDKTASWALGLEQELTAAQARVAQVQDELAAEQSSAREVVAAYEAKIDELHMELRTNAAAAEEALRHVEEHLQKKVADLAKCVELLDAAEETVKERTLWAQSLQARVEQLEQMLAAAQSSRWVRLGRRIGVGPDLHNS
ncbi:class I SAM-dependent methyltransferase [Paludibaculum fermentans]|uniref:Methyltransferase domain-containing protein n=1 Tax=Paludibaculum fermentans TaxID=1473598 RepID=A0A7S7SJB7_PALFE|nr:class I SAM-dependent methyltransferase [Paludibaculum fermentans]QOY85825.1 methyltransferase domain-containing protein [Paludibaculum fermentans]